MTESQTKAQQKYRNKPEVRERYLLNARKKSKEWYSNPENRLRRHQYNKNWWQERIKELEKIAGRLKPEICELCGKKDTICFDHDHNTGKFRGWICKRCNTVLGKVNDNPELLKALINYLNVV